MTIRDLLVRMLDRKGGRGALAAIATMHARRLARVAGLGAAPVRVFYDPATKCWGRRHRQDWLIDSPRFSYFAGQLQPLDGDAPWRAHAARRWFHHAELRPGETVLDVGAEIGTDTLAYADLVGPTGRVLAIEAHPETFVRLARTVELSRFPQITPVFAAVTASPGTVTIADGVSSLSSTLVTDPASQRGRVHTVRGVTLDALCDEHGITDIALLKMNIEGAETPALEGMRRMLTRVRHVVIACHDFRADRGEGEWYRTREHVTATLAAAGFEILPNELDLATTHISARDYVHARRAAPRGPNDPGSAPHPPARTE